ncbi:hypothetical protein OA84_08520 [Kaistella solincola]|uniref:DUF4920 domain-containing protein n=1 Tax=Kaistella solincola TaxID=510955 RepID=A0ABR4ZQG5_9FLAO|nr:DUF4920 domain-containing protein [Kaistella solincola]KIA83538.1 hypothetical protein OA84_08520 [Kaistella solincola]
MKKFAIVLSVMFATTILAQETPAPPAGKALVGDFYGAQVSAKAEKMAISPAELDQKLSSSAKLENIAVKGKVVEVCENKGCWMTIKTDNNERFFVKMKDYAFFVPTSLVGKNIILEGNAETKTISVEEQRHYAEDAKKPTAEIEAITKPKEEIRFLASGIRVVK